MDPQSPGYDPKPLVQYLAALGVPYFFEEQGMSSYKPCKQSQCFHRLFFPIRTFVNSFCIKIKKNRGGQTAILHFGVLYVEVFKNLAFFVFEISFLNSR